MMIEYEATMHGISRMYVKLFEKLGWMIIANNKKDKEKTKMYLHTLKQFKKILKESSSLDSIPIKTHLSETEAARFAANKLQFE